MLAILCFFAECGLLGKLASQSALDWSLFSWRKTWKKYLLIAGWLNLLSSRLHSAWSLRSYSKRRRVKCLKITRRNCTWCMRRARLIITVVRFYLSLEKHHKKEMQISYENLCVLFMKSKKTERLWLIGFRWCGNSKNTPLHKDTRQNSMNW